MASQSVYVYDTLEALTQGTIPGEFSGTIFNFPTITSTNSHGKKMLWTISVYLLNSDNKKVKVKDSYLKQPVSQLDGFTGVISVDSHLEGRPSRAAVETFITTGKNIGKKNATNVITQAFRDALGKYTNKLKTASADTVEDQNKGEMYPPVLIKKNGDTKATTVTTQDVENGVVVQPKLDGVRVVSYYDQSSNNVVMYSRKLGIYPGKQHIKDDLKQLLQIANDRGYTKIYLDGEVYKHGLALQDISGQSRRTETELDEVLEYHIFDCFFPDKLDMKSSDRQRILDIIFNDYTGEYCKRVENIVPSSLDEVLELKDVFMQNGYEGIIVRRNNGIYKYSYNNARTNDIIKFKGKDTDEFECIGYKEGKGKNKGVLTWVCKTKDGIEFAVDPKIMTFDERKHLFEVLGKKCKKDSKKTNFEYYILGPQAQLTVEYEDLSKKGVPLRLKALTFRTYEDKPGADLISELMKL